MDDAHPPKPREALQFERLVFFSDAVFAIAITLLVLDIRLPAAVGGTIHVGGLSAKLLGFVLSFFVIGIYWLAHHRLFGGLRREDRSLRVMNLVFLASIAFLPFPTTVITDYPGEAWAVIVYALSVALVGVMLIALILVARRPGLMHPGETRAGTFWLVARAASAPTVFVLSCFIAPSRPLLAMYSWMLIIPAQWIVGLLSRRQGRAKG